MEIPVECSDKDSKAIFKMDERRLANNDKEKYKQLNKKIRKMFKEPKEEYLEECSEKKMEELEKNGAQMMRGKKLDRLYLAGRKTDRQHER